MPLPRHRLPAELADELTGSFVAIRQRLGVPEEFPPEAVDLAERRAAEAEAPAPTGRQSAPSELDSPSKPGRPRDHIDRRDLPLLSIDPEGSRDLDQALHLERDGSGYTFHYAIADVAHWVEAGDAIDVEARRRGTTIYCPDRRIPLHPTALSEGAASLLQDQDRPALLWTIRLDQHGEIADIDVERAVVRNRRALSYAGVQAGIDGGSNDEQFRLLEEVGELRIALEVARGGVSLELPEQIVERVDEPGGSNAYSLRYDEPFAVEHWNAQLSLCCGMAAARLMLDARCGILRTLPPADPVTVERLRLHSAALGVPWPASMTYPQWVRTLDPSTPAGAALMTQAAATLRGSNYLAFDGDVPAEHSHHAIAADYAHVTAPLRRLVDRFGNECVLAAAAGTRPPGWALEALPEMPGLMTAANRLASQVDRAVVDVAEAAALQHRVGETFDAVVTGVGKGASTVQLTDPAVIAGVPDRLEIGASIQVRLAAADATGAAGPTVRFEVSPASSR